MRPRSRAYAIFRKELIEIWRDKRTLALVLGMPVMLLLLYGYGVSTDIRNIPMSVLDYSKSAVSRGFLEEFTGGGFFQGSYVSSPDELDKALDSGRARVGVIIPPDFAQEIAAGRTVPVYFAVDGSEPNTANAAVAYIQTIVARYDRVTIQEPIDLRTRIWYNPELRSINFIVPGLVAIILMTTAALLTSGTIVREREVGTMEPLIASPIKSSELMGGKIAAYTLISFVDIALVLAVGTYWFGVPFRGSVALLAVMSAIFLLSSLGLGLLISARSQSQQSAILLAFFTTMIPGLLLSGFLFPISSMPQVIQLLTYLIPARYFLVIVRGIFLKGVGIGALWPQALPMTALGIILFALSIRSFRKQL
ncbi:MAG: ABC transporter permease [Armatimonadota bacterium]